MLYQEMNTFTFISTWAFMLYQEMNIFVKLDLSIHALPGDEYLYFYFNLSVYDPLTEITIHLMDIWQL